NLAARASCPLASPWFQPFHRFKNLKFLTRSCAMKRFSVLLSFAFLVAPCYAQDKSAISQNSEKQGPPTEESRVKVFEEQVRSLAEQVALLRGELSALRDTKSVEPPHSTDHLLLASSHMEPGALAATTTSPAVPMAPEPAPASPQVAQTQTYGGAT